MSQESGIYHRNGWGGLNSEIDMTRECRPDQFLEEYFSSDVLESDSNFIVHRCQQMEFDHECGDSDGTEDSIATTAATVIHSMPQSVCSDVTTHTECLDFKHIESRQRGTNALRDILEPCFDTFALEDCPAPSAAAMLLQVGTALIVNIVIFTHSWIC